MPACLIDAEVFESTHGLDPLRPLFRSKGRPASLAQSFSQITELGGQVNNTELSPDKLIETVNDLGPDKLGDLHKIAMNFSENIMAPDKRISMSAEVLASVSVISVDEAASVYAYTMESGPYKVLNKLLGEQNRQQLKPFVEYLWLLMNGLSKCPRPTVPLVYRRVPSSVSTTYVVGRVITWWSFASCTIRLAAFKNKKLGGISEVWTEFHITLTTNRARNIRHLSATPDQNEILLPPNTRLRVMDKADRGGGLWVVQLLEEPCLDPILVFRDQQWSPSLLGKYPNTLV